MNRPNKYEKNRLEIAQKVEENSLWTQQGLFKKVKPQSAQSVAAAGFPAQSYNRGTISKDIPHQTSVKL